MKRLDHKMRYNAFINARNQALEGLLLKSRAKAGDDLRHFMLLVQTEINRTYPYLNKEFLDPTTMNNVRGLDNSIDRHAYTIALQMSQHWISMRAYSYALSHAGQQQAIIQTKDGKPLRVPHEDIQKAAYASTLWGPLSDRAYLALSRLRRGVMDAVEMSRIMGDSLPDCMSRVLRVFPAPQRIKQPRVLRRIKEADQRYKDSFKFSDFLTDDEWEEIVDDYKNEFIPKWRDPRMGQLESPVSIGDEEGIVVYPYQLENEMTEDFVTAVRNGEHDGANKQGITDFVWIAILDDKTDKCCQKRDGLTTAEIKDKLSGEWQKDECRASTPPAHFNCRCRLAPATDDLPEVPDTGEADFQEWLNS